MDDGWEDKEEEGKEVEDGWEEDKEEEGRVGGRIKRRKRGK